MLEVETGIPVSTIVESNIGCHKNMESSNSMGIPILELTEVNTGIPVLELYIMITL